MSKQIILDTDFDTDSVEGSDGPFALSARCSLRIDPTSGEYRWGDVGKIPIRQTVRPTMAAREMADRLESLIIDD